jgi:serine protease Do
VEQSDLPRHIRPFIDPEQLEQYRMQQGEGTGFFISADGYLLTNNHVVSGADEVTVTLLDERTFDARVVGTDPNTDIALVKVEADTALPHVQLGSSDATRVGDRVVAIGNPFGLSHTVTEGIVSAKGRVIGAGPYDDFLQTDASINPGNSGGPLFNLAGEVVGINTAINPRGQGIGFSVPIDQVRPLIDDLKEDGKVSRGWMGVGLQELDPMLAKHLGKPDLAGTVVGQVYPGTPAASAGLESGDIIIEMDGQPVKDSATLVRSIGTRAPGEKVSLKVLREGRPTDVKVKLGERPDREELEGRRR